MNKSINQFELRKKLQDAFRSGRYMITVTVHDEQTGKLNHFYAWDNFPADDVIPSLEHIALQVEAQSGEPQTSIDPETEPR
jgi:hypothetical protein